MANLQYNPNFELDTRLNAAGASKTIYALVMPESERVLLETIVPVLRDGRETIDVRDFAELLSMYHQPWTHKQDAAHEEFFSAWREWVKPVVTIGDSYTSEYPTAGASEGLYHLISSYGNFARFEKFEPTIHIFGGEYEGYPAYARSMHIPYKEHFRSQWREAINEIGPRDQVYLSQPSALDGNIWPDFENFVNELNNRQPTAEVIADLTYVGAVARDFHINLDHPNIKAVVFSLSKPMGTYYHRIGGLMAKKEMDDLFGNKWFKLLLPLRYGTELMQHFDVHELPKKYAGMQNDVSAQVSRQLNVPMRPSDVFLIATLPADAMNEAQPELARHLTRPASEPGAPLRLCLSPGIAGIIEPIRPWTRLMEPPELPGTAP